MGTTKRSAYKPNKIWKNLYTKLKQQVIDATSVDMLPSEDDIEYLTVLANRAWINIPSLYSEIIDRNMELHDMLLSKRNKLMREESERIGDGEIVTADLSLKRRLKAVIASFTGAVDGFIEDEIRYAILNNMNSFLDVCHKYSTLSSGILQSMNKIAETLDLFKDVLDYGIDPKVSLDKVVTRVSMNPKKIVDVQRSLDMLADEIAILPIDEDRRTVLFRFLEQLVKDIQACLEYAPIQRIAESTEEIIQYQEKRKPSRRVITDQTRKDIVDEP